MKFLLCLTLLATGAAHAADPSCSGKLRDSTPVKMLLPTPATEQNAVRFESRGEPIVYHDVKQMLLNCTDYQECFKAQGLELTITHMASMPGATADVVSDKLGNFSLGCTFK